MITAYIILIGLFLILAGLPISLLLMLWQHNKEMKNKV